MCESILKTRLFEIAKTSPVEMQRLIKTEAFAEDSAILPTIKKLDYLSLGILGFHNGVTNYYAKLGHHLHTTYTENKFFGASYLTAGAALLLSDGLTSIYSAKGDESGVVQRKIGIAEVVIGAVLMASPIVNSFIAAARDEP